MKRARFLDGSEALISSIEESISGEKAALVIEFDHLNDMSVSEYSDLLSDGNSASVEVIREDGTIMDTFSGYKKVSTINKRLAGENMVVSVRLERV